MSNLQVDFIQNYFFEIFSLKHPIFGTLSLGYFNALKEIAMSPLAQQKETLQLISKLCKNSAIIAGDLNSTPSAINKVLSSLNITIQLSDIPTYFFSAPNFEGSAKLPCFDNFLILDKSLACTVETFVNIPEIVSKNPREVMRDLQEPSDHIPVICHLQKGSKLLNIASYNIADPVFWSKKYPMTADGFDISPKGEIHRIEKLKVYIDKLLQENDIVSLQEVPATLVGWLESQAKMYSKNIEIHDDVVEEKDEKGFRIISKVQPENISKLVLIYV